MSSQAKRKAHRKALRESEFIARDKQIRAKEKWLKEYYESRSDYPVTNKNKILTKEQLRKFWRLRQK